MRLRERMVPEMGFASLYPSYGLPILRAGFTRARPGLQFRGRARIFC